MTTSLHPVSMRTLLPVFLLLLAGCSTYDDCFLPDDVRPPPRADATTLARARTAFAKHRFSEARALARERLAEAPADPEARDLLDRLEWILAPCQPRSSPPPGPRGGPGPHDRLRQEIAAQLELARRELAAGRRGQASEACERALLGVRWAPYGLDPNDLDEQAARLYGRIWPRPPEWR